jgi:hypothetical protein
MLRKRLPMLNSWYLLYGVIDPTRCPQPRYYLQRNSFAGKVRGRTFGTGPENLPGVNLLCMEDELSAVRLRLAR